MIRSNTSIMNPLNKTNSMETLKWFLKPRSFWFYFFVLSIIIVLGIFLRLLTNPMFFICEKRSLLSLYSTYVVNDIPEINKSFFSIFSGNLIAALILFLFPYFVIFLCTLGNQIEQKYYSKIALSISYISLLSKSISYFLCFAWSVNTFKLQCLFQVLPSQIIFLTLFPHGVIEVPAFIFSAGLGLISIDYLIQELKQNENITLKELGQLFISTFNRVKFYILLILIMIFIAAIIESWITPQIVKLAFENYFQVNNITL